MLIRIRIDRGPGAGTTEWARVIDGALWFEYLVALLRHRSIVTMNGRFVRMPLLGSWKSRLSAEPGPSYPAYGVPGNRKGGGTTTVGAVERAVHVVNWRKDPRHAGDYSDRCATQNPAKTRMFSPPTASARSHPVGELSAP